MLKRIIFIIVLFVSFNSYGQDINELRKKASNSSDSELIFNEEFLSNFEQHLQILIKKIIENDFTVGENSDSCKYCSHLELSI